MDRLCKTATFLSLKIPQALHGKHQKEFLLETEHRSSADNIIVINKTEYEVHYRHAKQRITPLIVINEATMLDHKELSDLQLIHNFEMDFGNLSVVLLVEQLRLNITLNQSTHKSLRQEIVINCHMSGINKEEYYKYILRKMKGDGNRQTVLMPIL